MESISTVLQTLMDKEKLSPRELAEGSGVNKNTIYTILKRNTNNVNIQMLKRLSDFFHVDISIFCGLTSYVPPIHLEEEEDRLLKAFRGHSGEVKGYVAKLVEEPPKELEKQERSLLSEYQKLNQDGKEKINDHLADVVAGGRYNAKKKENEL